MSNQIKQLEQLEAHEHKLSLAMESLIKISDAAMESLQIGGIHPQSYSFLQTSLAGPMQLAGFNQPVTSSLESFALGRNRLMATQVSLEGIGEVLKKIWEMIVDAAQRIWQWVRNHINVAIEHFEHRVLVIKRLEGMLAKSGDLVDGTDSVVYSGAKKKMLLGDTIDAKSLIDAVKKLTELAKGSIEYDKSYLAAVRDQIHAFENSLKKDGDFETFRKVMTSGGEASKMPTHFSHANFTHKGDLTMRGTALKLQAAEGEGDNGITFSTQGNIRLTAAIDVLIYKDRAGVSQIRSTYYDEETTEDGLLRQKLKLFSKEDIRNLLKAMDEALAIVTQLKVLNGEYDSNYTSVKKTRQALDLLNAVDNPYSAEIKALVNSLGRRVRRPPLTSRVLQLHEDLLDHAITVVWHSLRRYE